MNKKKVEIKPRCIKNSEKLEERMRLIVYKTSSYKLEFVASNKGYGGVVQDIVNEFAKKFKKKVKPIEKLSIEKKIKNLIIGTVEFTFKKKLINNYSLIFKGGNKDYGLIPKKALEIIGEEIKKYYIHQNKIKIKQKIDMDSVTPIFIGNKEKTEEWKKLGFDTTYSQFP